MGDSLNCRPFAASPGTGLLLLGRVAVRLFRTLVAALVVPAASVDLALDLVRLHRSGIGLHVGLLDRLPRIARVALPETPLTGDLVCFALFGDAVHEVALAVAGGLRANLA